MKQVMAGDTDDAGEDLYVQLGPMTCEGGNETSL